MAKIHVQVVGGSIQEKDGVGTVGELKAILSVPNHAATVNGDPVDNTYELQDFEFVSLAPAVKGASLHLA